MGQITHFIFTSLFAVVATATNCYNPDGSLQVFSQPAFQPCNQVIGVASMCCGTNWTGGIIADDICQPNGLCLNSDNGKPLYWRSSCTDPTWESPLCLGNLCTTYNEGGDPTQNVAVTECDDGSWCCQGGNTNCCDQGLGVKIAAIIGKTTPSTTPTSSKSNMPSSPTSSDSSITQIITPASPPDEGSRQTGGSGLSTGAKAGIGIAATIIGIAIGALGMVLWRRRRKLYDVSMPAYNANRKYDSVPTRDMRPVEADSREKSVSRVEADSRERPLYYEMG